MDNHPGSSIIFQNETISTSADGMSVSTMVPEKRRPGRPKGSGKKYPDGAPPKIKRPVGRPRKDGFPAGSVATARSRKSASAVDTASVSIAHHLFGHQDPKPIFAVLNGDFDAQDWVELSRTKPGTFINTLVTMLASQNPTSPAGTVEDAFKTHINSLVTPPNQILPSLYSVLRTFWLPTSPTYFCLTASNATRPILEFRFLYWDPQPLVFNGIACPTCTSPLMNRGRISSGPVKIYDLEQPFFIIGCEYVCTSPTCATPASPEGRKYASTDPSILRSLPNTLADEFPARLRQFDADMGSGPEVWNWQAIGVSKGLWNMVQGSLRSGVKKEVILQIIRSVQQGLGDSGVHPPPPPPPPPPPSQQQQEQQVEPQEQPQQQQHDELEQQQPEENDQEDDELMAADDPIPPITAMPPPNPIDTYKAYTEPWKLHHPSIESDNTQSSNTQSTGPSQSQPAYMFSHTPPQPPQTPQHQFSPSLHYPPPYFAASSSSGSKVGTSPTGAEIPSTAVAGPSNPPPPPPPPSSAALSPPKRGYSFGMDPPTSGDGPRKRSPRHCSKCGSADCKGKGGRSFCSNACRDCGKLDCMGRTNRRNVCQNRNFQM